MALCAIGPMGSISASGQCPLQIYFCHFRQSGNCSFRASQSSQKSSEMRHSWATLCKCFMFSTGAGPGERLRTKGLFLFLSLRPVPLRGINGPQAFFIPSGHKCREVRRPGSALRPPPRNPPQHFLCEEILGTPGIPVPQKCDTGARGPRLRAEKACGPQRRATLPCNPFFKRLCRAIRQSAPAGVSQACGLAIPNTGAPGRCGTLQHTRCAELPGSLPGTIRASAKARVTPWISLRTSVLPGA